MDNLSTLLQTKYGITPDAIFPATGGFSTKAAYRVTGAGGVDYFVKVYDNALPTTRCFVQRIDLYMPVLDWLSNTSALSGRVLTPVPAQDGTYKAESDGDMYVVFLFVRGDVPGIEGVTYQQTAEVAELLAALHETGDMIPFETLGLAEDISLPFCNQLIRYLSKAHMKQDALFELVSPHTDMLMGAAHEALRLRDTIRIGYAPLVLCHGDAHGGNLIQSNHLVLADWEDLRWAPAEADLFIHAWHPHGDALLEAYSTARRGYRINRDLLYFYTLRRRIEDIWVDIQRLTEESPDEIEGGKLLDWIRTGIDEVGHLTEYIDKRK